MKNDKPIIVFTTFWDAEFMISNKFCVYYDNQKLGVLYLNYKEIDDNIVAENYTVCSIALMHPDLNFLPNIKEQFNPIRRLDFFCPTFNMLKTYKDDKDWETYTKNFKDLIRNRKDDILSWIDSLKGNHIYILCCWENTVNGSNCHRKLIYDAFTKSKSIKDKAIYVYKHGSKGYVKKSSVFNAMLGAPVEVRDQESYPEVNDREMEAIYRELDVRLNAITANNNTLEARQTGNLADSQIINDLRNMHGVLNENDND